MTNDFKKKLIGNLMIFGTIVIYSLNTNYMKMVVPDWIGPFGLVFFRCSTSLIGFWIITLFLPRKELVINNKKDKFALLVGGMLGMGANMLLYITGLDKSGPIDAFIIRTCQPIIVLALSIIFFHSGISWNKVIGIMLGIGGTVYMTIFQTKHAEGSSPFLGDILLIGGSLFYSAYLVWIKPYTIRFNPFLVLRWMALAGTVLTMPFGIKELIEAPLWHRPFDLRVTGEIVFILVFSTMIVNILIVNALKYVSSFTASVYIFLLPVTGSLISVWMGIQTITANKVIAFILILAGFVFVNLTRKSKNSNPHFPTYHH